MPDSPGPPPDSPDRRDGRGVPVLEAARLLGTTPDSVRAKLRRGTLEGYRDNAGRWRVLLPDSRATDHARATATTSTVATVDDSRHRDELVAELQARIEDLQAALEVERDRVDRLMQALAEPERARTREPERRPWPGLKAWWRRFLEGGEP